MTFDQATQKAPVNEFLNLIFSNPVKVRPFKMPEQDALTSAIGVDYSQLRNLLAAGQWQQADEETGTVMLKIARRVTAGWLREEDFTEFPCLDLNTIDGLWVKYSKAHFGFSIQSRIWESVGEDYTKFSDAVGWRLNYNWQPYLELTFKLDAPVGYLPASPFFKSDGAAIGWAATLVFKLAECCADDF